MRLLNKLILLISLIQVSGFSDSIQKISFEEEFTITQLLIKDGEFVQAGELVTVFNNKSGESIEFRIGQSGWVEQLTLNIYDVLKPGQTFFQLKQEPTRLTNLNQLDDADSLPDFKTMLNNYWNSTGISGILTYLSKSFSESIGRLIMIGVGLLLLFLAISKGFEPLLLVPIGFGCILANIPLAGMNDEGGLLYYVFNIGISTGVFPLLIFMGVGAMTDFGPMIANPKTALLGGAAQFGIFFTLIGAILLSSWIPGINFSFKDASAIGIIGGADGPTAIFLASQLSPRLLGSIAVAAYSYMALVPIIQPPIMKALTTKEERQIKMSQLRAVSKLEKIIFPLIVLGLCFLLLPSAAPLIGMFMFGNLMRECGVVERLSNTTQNALINIVTIFLGLGVGSKLSADKFLKLETLGILVLGIVAFSVGTASGILMAKLMNRFTKERVNPLIGSAGVSAVPMAARVSNSVGMQENSQNFLLFHAMGPNVAGVIGSAVAAGVLLSIFRG